MPQRWSDESDKLLLLEMHREAKFASLNTKQWDNIGARLPTKPTGSACMQRFNKVINKLNSSSESPSVASTPSSKRKANSRPSHYNDQDDEESKHVTPKRAKKSAPTSAEKPAKIDDQDSDDDELKHMFEVKTEDEVKFGC